ncbi:hypothetical protein ACQJ22_22650 [Pseudomonas fragariae (ex Marin et al. 2024)]|uniref:hypothetical protein n=1 Tax=Pseudomonas TaxID=286 RepID=UPI000445D8B4|nr:MULTISPECIES: hypothetical protein [Pseudomonas]AKF44472.1 hypothetical protein PsyrB_04725 [Pseudomonas syringae pv. syringae B301D]EXL29917.1 hypothetical protein PssB301D_03892 [Pseudomonas syringae pv. syringae str. B301D-R]MCA5966977.1 hypothetical protein [Pseudomonas sp. P129]MCH5570752.1 hypothetical protein [Pseudomonas syringae pv. syringae]MEE1990585.1 hypothetical protein [Pseudomonas syringae pv. syringae]
MSTINDIVISENPRDVVQFITRGKNAISYPALDRLYSNNNWANISNNLELLKLIETMKSEGIIEDIDGGLRKGPHWKEPAFIAEKKYTFE